MRFRECKTSLSPSSFPHLPLPPPHPESSFPTYRSKMNTLLQFLFVHFHFIGGVCFVIIGFSSPSFVNSEKVCFVIVAFPSYLHLYFWSGFIHVYRSRAVTDNTRGQNSYLTCRLVPASILYKSIAGRYRPVSYPDGPITARYRLIKNAYWGATSVKKLQASFSHCFF